MSRTYHSKSKNDYKPTYLNYLTRADEPDENAESENTEALYLANKFLLRSRLRHNIKRLRHTYER